MIRKVHISGVHSKLTSDIELYVQKKIGNLDRFIPKAARESAHAEIKIKEKKSKDKKTFECEVIVGLPQATLAAHRSSTSIPAAIDEVEENLKKQLKKYKDRHSPSRLHRHVIARFRRKEK